MPWSATGRIPRAKRTREGLGAESLEDLVSPRHSMIWRKVGRTEPPKAARAIGAAVTSLRPGTQVPGLDALLPPGAVDHECRPYELGWLLYAWGRS